ncbi:MAG: hypothetical protein ACRED1_05340, partial [Limisphaerales bacterium]
IGSAVFRYGLAVFYAFLINLVLWFVTLAVPRLGFPYTVLVFGGFAAVFLPAFILRSRSRIGCAIFLFFVEMGLYVWIVGVMASGYKDGMEIPRLLIRPWSVMLLVSGLLAVLIHCFLARWRRRETNP